MLKTMLKTMLNTLLFVVFVAYLGCVVADPTEDKLIPRSVLFSDPKYRNPQISYDGKMLAYLSPCHGVLNVWVGKLGKHKSMHPVTHQKGRGVAAYWWGYDNEHIIYADDYKGNENWRIYQVNLKNNRSKILFSSKNVQCRVIAFSKFFPDEILIGINKRRKDFHDIYKLNIKTGQLSLVYENNLFDGFVCNEKLKLVVGSMLTEDGGGVLYRLGKNFSKAELLTMGPTDLLTSRPISLNKAEDLLYFLDGRNNDTATLSSINLKSKEVNVIAQDSKSDIDNIFFHPQNLTPEGYSAVYEKQRWVGLSKEFQSDITYLNSVAGGEFEILSASSDNQKWIVGYNRDVGSPRYYYYDRAAKKAYFLFSSKPLLDRFALAPMKPVVIKTRDGLSLVSYFSVPNRSLEKPIPMVLLVHGGPHARDYWGYNGAHQWLVNRGYAVLSVNYRGSSGFGKNFSNAGNGEWGGKMHDDLVDAVEWAVSRGGIDKDKIAIIGGSYGGFATLVGLTKTPDLFACGVDIVGPSNLITLMQSIPDYWKPFYFKFKQMIGGDPETKEGRNFLASRSPITYVNKIKKPLLIGHGAHDPRVKQAESEQIVDLMISNNIPVTYVLYPDEGHGFVRAENKQSFFAITEKFLADHLNGRLEPIKEKDFFNSSLRIKAGKEIVPSLSNQAD